MAYELLSKLYYKDYNLYQKELAFRKDKRVSVSLGFEIKKNEAFYYSTPDFLNIIPKIYKKYAYLDSLCSKMPKVAYEFYQRKCLIDEIIITNDIEGIRSTRKEIIEILDDNTPNSKDKRFSGLVHKYLKLLNDNKLQDMELKTCQDVRNIYNDIVLNEIQPSNWPDGDIFRKDIAEVVSGTQQVKHVGVYPESTIISYMDRVLSIINNDDIPQLFRTAILHYMIGYIHPFYDGNGRLSRFLSSYLLKKEFNTLVALRLSYTIKNKKKDYYEVFDTCNDAKNGGDITPFLIYFANIVEESIDSLIEKFESGLETLNSIAKLLNIKYNGINKKEEKKTRDVIWYLAQNDLFSNEHFDKKSLANVLEVSPGTAHSYVLSLIESGVPITIEHESRKFIYKIDIDELYNFLVN